MVVGVWERKPALSAFLAFLCPSAAVVPAQKLPCGSIPDLLVLSPDLSPQGSYGGRCQALLLPGHLSSLAGNISCRWAVSYGGSRDTLTLSSRGVRRCSIALQRDILTLTGKIIERQELCLPFCPPLPPLELLAGTGVQLLLGIPPKPHLFCDLSTA